MGITTVNDKKRLEMSFGQWSKLWQSSPETFEDLRTQRIESFIDSVPERHKKRLRCLQWKIDRVRERAANPLAATIAISEMMWQSFSELGELYKDLYALANDHEPRRVHRRTATVLPFHARTAFARG